MDSKSERQSPKRFSVRQRRRVVLFGGVIVCLLLLVLSFAASYASPDEATSHNMPAASPAFQVLKSDSVKLLKNRIYLPFIAKGSAGAAAPAAPPRPDGVVTAQEIAPPGGIIQYSISIQNTGDLTATGVIFTDTPDLNTDLFVGSVTTSQGLIVKGNSHGDTRVQVNIGSVAPAQTINLAFNVRVRDPLPPAVTLVQNQGFVLSDQLPPAPSDDPDTGAPADPTITLIHQATYGLNAFLNQVRVDTTTNRVWVAARNTDRVYIVNGASMSILQQITVGRAPFDIAVVPANKRAYVTNFGSYTSSIDINHMPSISVIDTTNPSAYVVTKTIPLSTTNDAPTFIVPDLNTGLVYAAVYNSNKVLVIDSATDTITATITIPANEGYSTFGIAVNPNLRRVYATNRSGKVVVINADTNVIVESFTLPSDGSPFVAVVNPSNNRLYVTYATDVGFANPNRVAVYDTSLLGTSFVTDLAVGNGAEGGIAVDTANNNVYVTNMTDDTVSVIGDTGSPVVIRTITDFFGDPFGVAINSVTQRVYVANRAFNSLSAFSDTFP